MEFHIPPLLVVMAAATLAPLMGEATARLGLPVIIFEILLGIAIGPEGLGLATVTGGIPYFSSIGLGFLFFLAGLEIDLIAIREKLGHALCGWILSLLIAIPIALLLRSLNLVSAWLVVAIAISTVGLGILLPILRDHGLLETPLGRAVLATAAVGELGPILMMSLVLSTRYTTQVQVLFTVAFLAAVIAVGWMVIQARTPRIIEAVRRTMTQSSQLPIRLCVLLLATLAVMAEELGLDLALGAMAAGMIVGVAVRGEKGHMLHHKLDALGFGFLIPVFFVASGMKLDISAIFNSSVGIALTFAFLGAILLTRIPVVALHRRALGNQQALSLGLFSMTTLSLVVALADIAVNHGVMTPAEAAPMIGAGMLTVVLCPATALRKAGIRSANE